MQPDLFNFDHQAEQRSHAALIDQIPHRIYSHTTGLTFGELFVSSCNQSPATERMFKEALAVMSQERMLDIFTPSGGVRRSAQQITSSDQIMAPKQGTFFF